ncbi:DUF2169 family type VI secretion system accessory protein [Sorangium sp. So ce124]|uniref:DUF2169 family type VI secretion system accessory protein n=1 Tax=Sorangium sp. So ce124 TaxID=3133280 RepID=UPI003F63AF9F
MKTKNLTPFPFGAKVTSRHSSRRPEMALIVRATYVLAPGKPLALPETPGLGPSLLAQGPMSADTYRDDDEERAGECLYPNDFADWKPRAEVMLRGTCYTPFGKPLPECPVRFTVGRWSKILRVVGRRFWSDDLANAVMSERAPFTKMPLGSTHAFGGAGYARNPVGKGFGGRELPNVEHAGAVIRSRRDDPGPAGFGPINPAWPQRAAKVGKEYGPSYRKERWPYFSADFDWSFFNAAPADQQLEGYLRGDEALVFQNMHPTAQVLETSLPGLRVRAFASDKNQRFREVPMSLDTLFVDLDACKLYLTWRGLDAIETDDMKDVETVLIGSEKLSDPPLPEQHYRGLTAAFDADPLGIKERMPPELLARFDEMQQRAKDRAEGKTPVHPTEAPDPLTASVRRALDAMPVAVPGAADIEKQTAEAVAQLLAYDPMPPDLSAQGAAAFTAGMAGSGAHIDVKAKIAEAAAEMDKSVAAANAAPAVSLRPGAPPAWAARSLAGALDGMKQTKAMLDEELNRALGEQTGAVKLPDEQAKMLREQTKKLSEDLAAFEKDPFFANILNRPAPQEPGPGKDLAGQDYEGRDLRGADLRGANLRDANLARANLRGARLAGARLDGAVLVEADLTGADLTGTDLTLANLTSARAEGAIFHKATLNRTFFEQANLSGASLAGAKGEYTMFSQANLAGIDGKDLSLQDALLRKADLAGADLTGASLVRCHFLEVGAKSADLTGATLTRSSFMGADLREAKLIEARGERSVWMKATLDDADFTRAILPHAELMEASASRACFRRAIMREAGCYRASLEHADFTESDLFGANLSKAAIGGVRFKGANLYDAKLLHASGKGCDFSGANLTRAMKDEA